MILFYKFLFRLFPRRRWGNFWCDQHWEFLHQNPQVDVTVAALGIVIALHEKDMTGGAFSCCKIPQSLLEGIFERSKGWI